jgi:hypothetical protein
VHASSGDRPGVRPDHPSPDHGGRDLGVLRARVRHHLHNVRRGEQGAAIREDALNFAGGVCGAPPDLDDAADTLLGHRHRKRLRSRPTSDTWRAPIGRAGSLAFGRAFDENHRPIIRLTDPRQKLAALATLDRLALAMVCVTDAVQKVRNDLQCTHSMSPRCECEQCRSMGVDCRCVFIPAKVHQQR